MICSSKNCRSVIHADKKCLKHYEKKRRSVLKLTPCTVCGNSSWRRKRCRECYQIFMSRFPHCSISKCRKPIFFKLKCQFHYKIQFKKCWRCHGKIYSGNYCRSCYDSRDKKEQTQLQTCCFCDNRCYMDKLCVHHYKQKNVPSIKCHSCSHLAVHQGRCIEHMIQTDNL